MTDSTATLASSVDEGHNDGEAHQEHGLSDKGYVRIAVILAAITAVEVAWSYLPWGDATGLKAFVEVGGLLVMMAIKFVIVAGYFMHLKFDSKVLTRVFYAGLALAVGVYVATLTTFHIFG